MRTKPFDILFDLAMKNKYVNMCIVKNYRERTPTTKLSSKYLSLQIFGINIKKSNTYEVWITNIKIIISNNLLRNFENTVRCAIKIWRQIVTILYTIIAKKCYCHLGSTIQILNELKIMKLLQWCLGPLQDSGQRMFYFYISLILFYDLVIVHPPD